MRKLLEELNKERLIDFLVAYAENDAEFTNAVNVFFRKPEFEKELDKIKKEIASALDGVSDYYNRDSWGNVHFDVSSIIAEIKLRTEQGHIRLAFAQLELLYRKLLENYEYQGECEIGDEAEGCLEIMSEIADQAVLTEDKEYIFRHCIELSELEDGKDYGADYEDKLLRIAAKFVTPQNLMELENALANFDFNWREEEFKLIRLEIIRKTEGESAVNDFIAENLQFPKIIDIAYDKAVLCKDFTEAEQLCINALSGGKQRYGISPWLYKLYSVYEITNNAAKIAGTAEEILLSGDLAYYDKLKSLLEEQDIWDSSYLELLHNCELRLSYLKYMEILAKEKECALLLEQLKKHMEQVYQYGKILAVEYPIDVCQIFTDQINKEAKVAYSRETYRKVCLRILLFSEAGYKDAAIEMTNDFKLKYKRKPAFVDELNKIWEEPDNDAFSNGY